MKKLKLIIPAVILVIIIALISVGLVQFNSLNKINAPITKTVIPFDVSEKSGGVKIKNTFIDNFVTYYTEDNANILNEEQQAFNTLLKDYKVDELFKKYFNIEDAVSPYLAITLAYLLMENDSVTQSEKDTLSSFLNHKDGFSGVAFTIYNGDLSKINAPIIAYSYSYEASITTDWAAFVVLYRDSIIHFKEMSMHVDNANRDKSFLNEDFTKKVQELKVDKILYKHFNFTEFTSPYCCLQLAYKLLDGNKINLVERYYLNKFVSAPEGYVEIFYCFRAD